MPRQDRSREDKRKADARYNAEYRLKGKPASAPQRTGG
jgi:hypothetical protein